MTERSGLSRRGLLGAVAGVTAATALPAAPAWGTDDQRPGAVNRPKLDKYDRQIVSGLSSDRALRHLQVLSEHIGPRIGGTTSEKRAADYIAGQLDKFGYGTRLEPFPVADKFLSRGRRGAGCCRSRPAAGRPGVSTPGVGVLAERPD